MGKLIDADALQQHFMDMQHYERCACNFMDDGGEPATEWYCVEDALENAPTIDAIPVEWLKYMQQESLSEDDRTMVGAIEAIFIEWYIYMNRLREMNRQNEQEAQD